ncbi:hypothetical protein PC9H_002695 [Pleurotus ostreatus]|uniref:Uncharacterized protein n=2 Tax=Pleurotus TaxID=5320 RepID=A0A8H7DMF8_PLEOS|nr:uncharacterized protein PC9H_002695 [Pleurotus ostreatus]KAF7416429.1 hypothetical protein PC9H_002695 [Pleurotus ostreatus]KAG9225317.1 hypothetical protein CCMSSC00406_0006296 [Pleurotus cornucopiae]
MHTSIQPDNTKLSAAALFPSLRYLEAPMDDLLLSVDAPPPLVDLAVAGRVSSYHLLNAASNVLPLPFHRCIRPLGGVDILSRSNVSAKWEEYIPLNARSTPPHLTVQNLYRFSATKLKYLRLLYYHRIRRNPIYAASELLSMMEGG